MKKAKWLCTAAAVLALSVAVAGCGGSDDKKAADLKAVLKATLWFIPLFILISSIKCVNLM